VCRRLAPPLLALALMCALSGCAGGSPSTTTSSALATPPAAAHTPSPRLATGVLVVTPHAAAGPVAADSHNLVWESGPIESDAFQPTLHDRNLSTGATRTLSGNVDPLFGLASTARFVFYARSSGNSTSVVQISHRGTDPRTVSDALVTAIASRGNVVAWGEQSGASERVVAYTGARRWIVAQMPRCTTKGCYRLDDVTVAEHGIVFTRDAVGSQASFVVRRAFGARKVQSLTVLHDPQPNLVPSSSGALYYILSRGWYRWDFGSARPLPVSFANRPLKQLIRHEGSRWYWLVRHGCSVRLESTRGGKATALAPPRRIVRLGPDYGPTCTDLGALAWAGTHAIAAWAIAAEAAEQTHEDIGLHGAVVSARLNPK
jgi:hypothetical protein